MLDLGCRALFEQTHCYEQLMLQSILAVAMVMLSAGTMPETEFVRFNLNKN